MTVHVQWGNMVFHAEALCATVWLLSTSNHMPQVTLGIQFTCIFQFCEIIQTTSAKEHFEHKSTCSLKENINTSMAHNQNKKNIKCACYAHIIFPLSLNHWLLRNVVLNLEKLPLTLAIQNSRIWPSASISPFASTPGSEKQ